MLSLEGRRYMERAPLLAIWPGLSLAIVVFGINMFGDALRDLLDPRLSGGAGRHRAANVKQAAEALPFHAWEAKSPPHEPAPPFRALSAVVMPAGSRYLFSRHGGA